MQFENLKNLTCDHISRNDERSYDFCSYCACASGYYAIVLMDRVDFTEGLSETFGSRSIFLVHDNVGNKFDQHLISIDLTVYKNTNKLTV